MSISTATPKQLFWSNDPTILFKKEYLFDIYPTTTMSYEQKLNSISRLVILLTFLSFIWSGTIRILIVGSITLLGICIIYNMHSKEKESFTSDTQSVSDTSNIEKIDYSELDQFIKKEFKDGTKHNPFSNVLLTDIADEPNRKNAPPSFTPQVETHITNNVKKMVQSLNPTIQNTNKQIFGDLANNFDLDQSNRAFYSTANTRVANDQGAFANFLYGNMPSGKDSDIDAGIQRVKDSYRHTLY
jgi:hypothetical protein